MIRAEQNLIDLKEANHQYINIEIKPKATDKVIPATFTQTFTQEFLKRGLDYNLAVVRFRIPISGIPYFYFKIQEGLGQTNPNLGIYSFTMVDVLSGDEFTEYVDFVPYDFSVSIPPAPSNNNGLQNIDTRYYNVYDVSGWIFMLNSTLNSCFNNLKAAHPTNPVTEAPFLIFNPETQFISFIVPYNYFTSGRIETYFGENLQGFFDSLEYDLFDNNPLTFGLFVVYAQPFGSTVYSNGYSKYGIAPTNPPAYIEMKGNYGGVEKFAGLRAFVIKTSLLPIRYENTNSTANNGDLSEDTILTDFNVSNYYGNRSDVIFFPQGPYRLIDILSNTPLRSIDLQIFWKDKSGFLRPMFVFQGDTLTIKLGFITKGQSN
jgi:hypothetical protein